MKPVVLLTLILMSISSLVPISVQAQNNQQAQQKAAPKKFEQVSLPDLPEYSGQAKLKLQNINRSDKGVSYLLVYRAKETTVQVHDWYLTALQGNKWTIVSSQRRVLFAQKGGNTCSVMFNAGMGKGGYATEFEITYFQAAPKQGQRDL